MNKVSLVVNASILNEVLCEEMPLKLKIESSIRHDKWLFGEYFLNLVKYKLS